MSNIDIEIEVYDSELTTGCVVSNTVHFIFILYHTTQYATYLQAKMDMVVSSSLEQQQQHL